MDLRYHFLEECEEDLLLFCIRTINVFLSFLIFLVEKIYVDDFLKLYNYFILINGYVNNEMETGLVFPLFKTFVFLIMVVIQLHTIFSGYRLSRGIQGYTKRSLKLFLTITLLEIFNECSLFLSMSEFSIYIYFYFYVITFVAVPIALIVLNKNCVSFVTTRLRVLLPEV